MKHFKTLSALTASSLMAFTMVTTPVFAVEEDKDPVIATTSQTIKIPTDTLIAEKSNGITLPTGMKYTFTPVYGNSLTIDATKSVESNTSISEEGGKGNISDIDFIKVGTVANKMELTVTPGYEEDGTANLKIDLNQGNINKPGIYYFGVSESGHTVPKANSDTGESLTNVVEGLSNTDKDQNAIVAVVVNTNEGSDAKDNPYTIAQVLVYKVVVGQDGEWEVEGKVTPDKGEGGAITNNYAYFNAKYETFSLTITKNVTGNMGDKKIPFTINVTPRTTNEYSKELKYDGETKDPQTTKSVTIYKDAVGTYPSFSLKHGESATYHGLTAADVVKIQEQFQVGTTATDKNGYTDSYILNKTGLNTPTDVTLSEGENYQAYTTEAKNNENVNDGLGNYFEVTNFKKLTKTETVGDKQQEVTATPIVQVTNNKEAGPITGIVHNYGPFALMVAVGVAFAGFFFRRRREE